MNLNRVTFTGADDSVDPGQLLEISARYPEVEWGILFSQKHQGSPRYPSEKWVVELVARVASSKFQPRLSAHLCGKWVRDFVKGIDFTWETYSRGLSRSFKRVQLNFHAEWHQAHEKFDTMLALKGMDYRFIFQVDGVNDGQVRSWCDRGWGSPLFDTSGGAGRVPNEWPESWPELYCGYAGGLGPENIHHQFMAIERVAKGWVWIDMERRVRSADDTKFELEKCLDVLRAVFGAR